MVFVCKLWKTESEQSCLTRDVQTQLDEDNSDSSSSIDDNDDDEMPKLSPVTDLSVSSSIYRPSAAIHTSSLVTSTNSIPRLCVKAENSDKTESTPNSVSHTQLYCICRTPYDETKYVIALSWKLSHDFKLSLSTVAVTCDIVLSLLYTILPYHAMLFLVAAFLQ